LNCPAFQGRFSHEVRNEVRPPKFLKIFASSPGNFASCKNIIPVRLGVLKGT
jgi:hypothetical protein